MINYIIIDEFGKPYVAVNITDSDLKACDDGILDVIRISDGKSYYQGVWEDLSLWNN